MKVKVKSRGDKRDLLIEVRGDAGEQIDYADVDRLQRAGDALIAPETDRRGDAWVLSYTVPGYVCLRSSSERAVGRPQFERTLRSVLAACRACERERLARRRVLFDPQWVAFNPASGKMRFAYVPLAAAWAPFEVSELLIWLGTHLEAADGAAWELMERTLNYARLSRVLACVDFEAFLIGCGAMASTGATGALGSMVDDDRPRPVEAPAPRGFDFVRLASQVGADDVSRAGRDAGGARSGADARGARVGSSGRGVSGARSGTSSCGTHGACVGASGYGSREARAGAPVREVSASPRGASTAPGAGAGSSPSTARDTSYAPMGASASAGALRESGSSGPSFSSAPGFSASSVLSVVVRRVSTGERWRLACGQYRMGREEDCEIPLTGNSSLSRHHALLTVSARGLVVRDEGSANGTYVEGSRVATGEDVPVRPGGWFALSNERFVLEA